MSEARKAIIGISCGDLNGVGLEVIMKTFANSQMLEICTPVLFASSKAVAYHRKALELENFSFNIIKKLDQLNDQRANLLQVWDEEVKMEFGKEDPAVGKYALKSLEAATKALKEGTIDALVTAPINKASIQSEDFKFKGHTDYLEAKFDSKAIMVLVNEDLRMALNTVHISLAEVPKAIQKEQIVNKITTLAASLKKDFLIGRAKIAVLSLNPHGGDNGLIGKEEIEIIEPAIKEAQENNNLVFGPFAADGFFGSKAYQQYDAILAMYHDQGLAPFKALSFGAGVNYSGGLPIIRTSPDHGTGFSIAGKGEANESSFRAAVYLACDLVKHRKLSNELTKNPLKSKKGRKEY